MIIDIIENWNKYDGISPLIKKALDYLSKTNFSGMDPGRYEIDGEYIFALVQRYDTKPASETKWENHKEYTDIQYISSGVEQIGFGRPESFTPIITYDKQKDIAFYEGHGDLLTLRAGTFAIFFPPEIHMPKVAVGNRPIHVEKIVIKVKTAEIL